MTKHFVFILMFITTAAFAQKAKVQTAINYLRYEELDKAKEAIDEAAINEGSMNMDKTWYYRGSIYEAISSSDKYKDLSTNALEIAYQSYKKALEIDPKSEFKDDIDTRMKYIKTAFFNKAVDAYNAKDYTTSLNNFEYVLKISPDDSLSNLYAANSAYRAKDAAKASQYYQKIIDKNQDNAVIYRNLASLYEETKDTTRAISILDQGRKKFPDDLGLITTEINIYLEMNKSSDATGLLNMAIEKDTKNDSGKASLYYALGLTYDNMTTAKNSTLTQDQKNDYADKAKTNYIKALESNPGKKVEFDANFGLGVMYFNLAADMLNKSSNVKDQKAYADAKAKVDAMFGQSQPYLEKAHDLNPKDHDTLICLKQLYFRENDMPKYYRIKDQLDAEGK